MKNIAASDKFQYIWNKAVVESVNYDKAYSIETQANGQYSNIIAK